SEGEMTDTPSSPLKWWAGLGLETADQDVPSQCSIRVSFPPLPTAHTSWSDTPSTASRRFDWGSGFGVGISVHPEASWCRAAVEHPREVDVGLGGVRDDRRFLLVDGEGRRLRSSQTAWPLAVGARYDAGSERLAMRFPDGGEVEGSAVPRGEEIEIDYHGRTV